jgi:ankyrin repeat protein
MAGIRALGSVSGVEVPGSGADVERFRRLDAAFRGGDMTALQQELGDRDGFPNVIAHPAIGACLTYAIYHGPLALVRALLEAGADPNWPTADGFPPLIAALSCSDAAPGTVVRTDVHELVEMLLAAGADVDQRDVNDYTPLHIAAAQGDVRAVDMLLAAGADPDEITRIDDLDTALEVAAAAGQAVIVDRLRPLTTRPAWEGASQTGEVAELARLVRTGHDIDARDGYGQTALMRAAHAGQADAVSWLIANGAGLDHTSKFGLSALMLAVIADHPRIARALVAAGANTEVRGTGAPGFNGKSAADLAEDRGDQRLARFLRAHPHAGD